MARIICPKCGFHQETQSECRRCGIVFARYRPPGRARPQAHSAAHTGSLEPCRSLLRRLFRMFRWVSLAAAAVSLLLILCPAPPPSILITPEVIQQAEAKVKEFQKVSKKKRIRTLELSESELNGWLSSNLALGQTLSRPIETMTQATAYGASRSDKKTATAVPEAVPTAEQAQSIVRDVKMELREDLLRAYVMFEFHGKELSLELEGRIGVQDGYLHFEPTAGKIGSFPLPQGTLESATQRLFESAENRDKFRVPPGVLAIRVDRSNLVIHSR